MLRNSSLARPLALAAALAFVAPGCREGTSPAITHDPVLLLGDGKTEDSVRVILNRAGIEVQSAGPYWEFDGSGLEGFSAVIFLVGYDYAMPMDGDVQQGIVNFVAAGGGLVTTEWMLYNTSWDKNLQGLVADIVPSLYGDDYSDTGEPGDGVEDYTRFAAGHPVAEGLPQTFSTPAFDWTYSLTTADPAPAKQAQVIFAGSLSGDAVVAGRHGAGRTLHWNMGGEYVGSRIWTPEMSQLLVNIVKYVSNRS